MSKTDSERLRELAKFFIRYGESPSSELRYYLRGAGMPEWNVIHDDLRRIADTIEKAPSDEEILKVKLGNVIADKNGIKLCVMKHNIDAINEGREVYTLVSERPHEDGDYSYLCGWEWCRCQQ